MFTNRSREKYFHGFVGVFDSIGGPRYMQEIAIKNVGSHTINLDIKMTKDTYKLDYRILEK
jgi:hypothetical protein